MFVDDALESTLSPSPASSTKPEIPQQPVVPSTHGTDTTITTTDSSVTTTASMAVCSPTYPLLPAPCSTKCFSTPPPTTFQSDDVLDVTGSFSSHLLSFMVVFLFSYHVMFKKHKFYDLALLNACDLRSSVNSESDFRSLLLN